MGHSIDSLGTLAAETAARAAGVYLRQHKMTYDIDALSACLKSWCKAKLIEALHDAKEAFDAGMGQMAEMTFKATMAEAGIEAAKECGMAS